MRQRSRDEAARAAERDERHVSRVATSSDGDSPNCPQGRGGGQRHDAARRNRHAQPQGVRDRLNRTHRCIAVEGATTPEEAKGVEIPERKCSIRDGGAQTSLAVTGWSGMSAGTFRADPQGTAIIDPRDRAAAGADGINLDCRLLHGVSLHRVDRDLNGRAIQDECDVGARAPHVEGDHRIQV